MTLGTSTCLALGSLSSEGTSRAPATISSTASTPTSTHIQVRDGVPAVLVRYVTGRRVA